MNVILLGAPGSGKGTQAKLLTGHFSCPWISLGDMLRAEVKKNSELGQTIKDTMARGELVSDRIASCVIDANIDSRGFILDGFPRTIVQAEMLETILQKKQIDLDYALYFEVSEETVVMRLTGRRICPQCGANYHIRNMPTQQEGICDNCGHELVSRKDDTPSVIKNRWEVFNKESKALVDYYQARNKLLVYDANGQAEDLFKEITARFAQDGIS